MKIIIDSKFENNSLKHCFQKSSSIKRTYFWSLVPLLSFIYSPFISPFFPRGTQKKIQNVCQNILPQFFADLLQLHFICPWVSIGNPTTVKPRFGFWFVFSFLLPTYWKMPKMLQGCAVVRALASHQCGPGSNPGVDAICGLSLLLVLSLTPRGFSPGTPVFPLLKNQHFQIPIPSGTHGHVSTSFYELLIAPWVNKLPFTIYKWSVLFFIHRDF